MDLHEADALARALMAEHGLASSWTFAFDNATRRLGQCDSTTRQITMSRHFASEADQEQVRDLILHEIAHALTPGAKHGLLWKAVAQRIGATPLACAENPFSQSDTEVAKRLASVEGKPYVRVNHPRHTGKRYRVLRENDRSYSLVADDGTEVRASRIFVYPDGGKPRSRAEVREEEARSNLDKVAGRPVHVVNSRSHAGKRFAILRRGNERTRHVLVDLATGHIVRISGSMVVPESSTRRRGATPARTR